MTERLEIPARAKINLTLDVLGKRTDGYHQVEMVMQTISLADLVTLENTGEQISVTCSIPDLPVNEENLAFRAAMALKEAGGYPGGVRIHLDKQIPLAAGLAGGSADAAAVLTGLNELWKLHFPQEELLRIGSALGSDVPFCLLGGTALATGRGEELTPLPCLPEMHLVLVKPPVGISTAQVYGRFNPANVSRRPDTRAMLAAIRGGDFAAIPALCANVLESVTLGLCPEIALIKERLAEAGATGVLMSGSGPTVFGFVADRQQGWEAARQLKGLGNVYVVRTER